MTMSPYTRIQQKFSYHLEDVSCIDCLYYKGKIRGCTLTACSCEDIKNDAIANSRIKRDRGWFSNARRE